WPIASQCWHGEQKGECDCAGNHAAGFCGPAPECREEMRQTVAMPTPALSKIMSALIKFMSELIRVTRTLVIFMSALMKCTSQLMKLMSRLIRAMRALMKSM